ncbi:MAG: DUF721 domain-containing protein [Candidatus Hydrogenedentes bacterium]|nr:DUF721 domain-containing protein [Candidatus Hydrogenedentota bacterium]
MKRNEPSAISDVLKILKKTSKLGKQLEQAQIWERWPELAGPKLATHGRPVTIKEETLYIEAESAAWVHRFTIHKWNILKRVNRMARKELITDVFVSLQPDE